MRALIFFILIKISLCFRFKEILKEIIHIVIEIFISVKSIMSLYVTGLLGMLLTHFLCNFQNKNIVTCLAFVGKNRAQIRVIAKSLHKCFFCLIEKLEKIALFCVTFYSFSRSFLINIQFRELKFR